MREYEAPAKLNLSLHVSPPRGDSYHPIRSLVQTVDWCDLLGVERADGEDDLEVEGLQIEAEPNLVLAAMAVLRSLTEIAPLRLRLEKRIPPEAGLGGASSDAAAALRAAADIIGAVDDLVRDAASRVGADVTLFLTGGTQVVSGIGETTTPTTPLSDMAFAVAVPGFGLSTGEVYRRWDLLEGPEGDPVPDALLPPRLRGGMPMRNDLLPAAVDIEPRLGDFMADLRAVWGVPVSLTGSGSACFAYFATLDEAEDAAEAASSLATHSRGVTPRASGVAEV